MFLLCAVLLPAKSLMVVAQENNYFIASPQLVRSSIIFKSARAFFQLKFEIEIPTDANNNLSRIIIKQKPDQAEALEIEPRKTQVLLLKDSEAIPINHSTTFTLDHRQKTNETIIDLTKPIPPDSRIEIILHVERPQYKENIHQYDVIVYPEGDNPRSINIGTAQFYLGWR